MVTLELLPMMGEVINMTGEPVRGAGWYGHTTGLHTVAIRVLNFQGRVSVQATIAVDPTETDWFSVLPNEVAYIQYPQERYLVQLPATGETSVLGFNFYSNVVWVRALVSRDYMLYWTLTPPQIMQYGVVDYVKLSY